MWVDLDQTIEDVKNDPISFDDFLDIYENFRESNPFVIIDDFF
jgi:hypothetical protein